MLTSYELTEFYNTCLRLYVKNLFSRKEALMKLKDILSSMGYADTTAWRMAEDSITLAELSWGLPRT